MACTLRRPYACAVRDRDDHVACIGIQLAAQTVHDRDNLHVHARYHTNRTISSGIDGG